MIRTPEDDMEDREKHLTGEEISLWLDGEADRGEAERIERHLMRCPVCRAEVEMFRRLSGLLASARMPDSLETGESRLWRKVEPQIAGTTAARRDEWAVPLISALLYFMWQAASVLFVSLGVASIFGVSIPYSWVLDFAASVLEALGLAWLAGTPGSALGLVGVGSEWAEWALSMAVWWAFAMGIGALFAGWLASRWRRGEGCPVRRRSRKSRGLVAAG